MEPAAEEPIRSAWEQGDLRKTMTLIVEAYGLETLAYLRAVTQPSVADDVYGQAVLDLWEGLKDFRWQCSARTYLFSVARNALARHHKLAGRARRREDAFARVQWLLEMVASDTRTKTPPHLRSEIKQRVRQLRESLPEDEQTLLILRIDRRLSYRELVRVMGEADAELDDEALARAAARVRKRFQVAKNKLRELMRDDGLLSG